MKRINKHKLKKTLDHSKNWYTINILCFAISVITKKLRSESLNLIFLQMIIGSLLLHAATNFFSCCMIRSLCCNYECTSHMRSENRQAVIFHSSLKFILIHRVIWRADYESHVRNNMRANFHQWLKNRCHTSKLVFN